MGSTFVQGWVAVPLVFEMFIHGAAISALSVEIQISADASASAL